jgi:hypothetical protein
MGDYRGARNEAERLEERVAQLEAGLEAADVLLAVAESRQQFVAKLAARLNLTDDPVVVKGQEAAQRVIDEFRSRRSEPAGGRPDLAPGELDERGHGLHYDEPEPAGGEG